MFHWCLNKNIQYPTLSFLKYMLTFMANDSYRFLRRRPDVIQRTCADPL